MNETLGALEESVLLLVASMKDEAYGFSVALRYQEHFGQRITISAIHTVLKRLESKGFIESSMGGATAERGGKL